MKKAVVFDADEILLNHTKGFIKFVEKHYNKRPHKYIPVVPYQMEKSYNVDVEVIDEWVNQFNLNSYEFGTLEAYDKNTVEKVIKLKLENPDVDFFVVTKCGNTASTEFLRKANLVNLFGDDIFEDIFCLSMKESKTQCFKKIMKTHEIVTFVDDAVNNIKDAMDLGIDSVMILQEHNNYLYGQYGYNHVHNWNELYEYISVKLG